MNQTKKMLTRTAVVLLIILLGLLFVNASLYETHTPVKEEPYIEMANNNNIEYNALLESEQQQYESNGIPENATTAF